jgi:hypothetical protein
MDLMSAGEWKNYIFLNKDKKMNAWWSIYLGFLPWEHSPFSSERLQKRKNND